MGDVPVINSAHALKDVLGAVIVQVAEGYAVSLLHVPKPAGQANFVEVLSTCIMEHPVRGQERKLGIARSHIVIQPPIVVQIPVVDSHTPHQFPGVGLAGHVGKMFHYHCS